MNRIQRRARANLTPGIPDTGTLVLAKADADSVPAILSASALGHGVGGSNRHGYTNRKP
jgi:hypothetical protein